jgi:UDP-glucose 4-epimerase
MLHSRSVTRYVLRFLIPTMSKAVLVTGGAGYIGSHTMLALTDRGERVVILDDLSGGSPADSLEPATFVEGNVGDTELVRSIIREHEIDTVIHFAAFIRIDESVREPEKYFKNNTENTRILAETVKSEGIKYFVYSSSASVYGMPKRIPVTEDDELAPISPYGESKVRAERLLQEMSSDDFNVAMLRYFNPAGADPKGRSGYRLNKKPTHMVPVAMRAALEGRTFTINGTDYETKDGTCVRDYIHVTDLAEAHLAVLEYLRGDGKTRAFNCGDGYGYSVREVLSAVERVTGKKMNIVEGSRREGDPAILVADISRIKHELGWKPKYDMEKMVADEYAWTHAHA